MRNGNVQYPGRKASERSKPDDLHQLDPRYRQQRTYLEKLYVVKGNSFKLVRQPKSQAVISQ